MTNGSEITIKGQKFFLSGIVVSGKEKTAYSLSPKNVSEGGDSRFMLICYSASEIPIDENGCPLFFQLLDRPDLDGGENPIARHIRLVTKGIYADGTPYLAVERPSMDESNIRLWEDFQADFIANLDPGLFGCRFDTVRKVVSGLVDSLLGISEELLPYDHTLVIPELRPEDVLLYGNPERDPDSIGVIIMAWEKAVVVNGKSIQYHADGLGEDAAPELARGLVTPETNSYSIGKLMNFIVFGKEGGDINDLTEESYLRRVYRDMTEVEPGKRILLDRIVDYFKCNQESREDSKLYLNLELASKQNERMSKEDKLKAFNDIFSESVGEKYDGLGKFIRAREEAHYYPMVAAPSKDAPGLSAVAGMAELKERITRELIRPMTKTEEFSAYKVGKPNGVLFFGPAGCGKTLLAKAIAEECGMSYAILSPAELDGTYVNSGRETVAALFEEARLKAPTVICIDEIDGLVPRRGSRAGDYHAEIISQLLVETADCGKDGIRVIGCSNFPQRIDPAMLRSGRLGIKIYVDLPDETTRESVFRFNLNGMPGSEGLDYGRLSQLTKGRVTSDIPAICRQAGILAVTEGTTLSMELLERAIAEVAPSVSAEDIATYLAERDYFLGKPAEKARRIGFKTR